MSIIHVNHIKSAILGRFENLIDLSDVASQAPEHNMNFLLTRSLAAFTIAELAGINDQIAASCVVDGGGDNGIDAIYYEAAEKICWVLQSKWINSGNGSIEVGDVQKFLQGVNDLLEGRFDRFNAKTKAKTDEIMSALDDSAAKFALVLAYTGQQSLSPEAWMPINDLVQALNDPSEMVEVRVMSQAELHAAVAKGALGDTVNMEVMLHEYGKVSEPFVAYYGQMAVADIADWEKFGQSLTARNLRRFRGSTDVNDGIARTLAGNPDRFWYFNNGITILCEKLQKKPLGGTRRNTGVFVCEGASVVNGAQTVGSIVQAAQSNPETLQNARVLVRLISLENCPPEFGTDLTRAANTQNRVEKRDFAALDPQQQRLKTDLLLEYKKEYAYQSGEQQPRPELGCTLDEAAVSLACAQSDAGLAVLAKREVSALYDDITKSPYTVIFNASTTAQKLWRSVEVMRTVDTTLKASQLTLEGKDRLIAVHGNRFALHVVFQKLGSPILADPKSDFEQARGGIPVLATRVLIDTIHEVSDLFPAAYPANLFKNQTKCKELARSLLAK